MSARRVSTLDLVPRRAPARPVAREAIGTVLEVRGDVVAVDLGDGAASPLRAAPGGYVVGGPARVALDADRAPVSVLGPARDAREGERVDVVMPGVVGASVLGELPPAEAARLEELQQDMADAKVRLNAAVDEWRATSGELAEQLSAAFTRIESTEDGVVEAITSADGKTRTYVATTPPSRDGVTAGDIWWQMSDEASLALATVVGQWSWSAAGWTPMAFSHQVITSVDIGVLTASAARISEAVVQALWAQVVNARKITADMVLIGSGSSIIPNGDVSAHGVGFEPFAWHELTRSVHVPAGAASTPTVTFPVAPATEYFFEAELIVVPAGTFARPLVHLIQRSVTGAVLQEAPLTPTSTRTNSSSWVRVTGTVTTSADAATGQISLGNSAPSGGYRIRRLSLVRKIDDALIVNGGILARRVDLLGQTTDGAMRQTNEGLWLTDENGLMAFELTPGRITWSVYDNGVRRAGIERDGDLAVTGLTVAGDINFDGGRSLRDSIANERSRLLALQPLQNRLGLQPGEIKGIQQVPYTVSGSGHRMVKVHGQIDVSGTAAEKAVVRLHTSTNPITETGNSVHFKREMKLFPNTRGGGEFRKVFSTADLGVQPGQTLRVLMSVEIVGSTGAFLEVDGAGCDLEINDVGPAIPIVPVTVTPTAPPTRAVEVARERVANHLIPCTGFRTFIQSGAVDGWAGSKGVVAHGRAEGQLAKHGMLEFATAAAEMAGAVQIESLTLVLQNSSWHWGTGGWYRISPFGAIPSYLPESQVPMWVVEGRTTRGGVVHVPLPSSTYAGVKSGATRSFALAPRSTDLLYYGTTAPAGCHLLATFIR